MTVLLLLLIVISVWVGFYQLVKQQGRILLRLDALEQAIKTDRDHQELFEDRGFDGLVVGTPFPNFELPDLSGKISSLTDFKGKRSILIHWNFQCGFCEAIAEDLAGLEANLKKQNAQILLLATGDELFNREHLAEHSLQATLLLLKGRQTPAPFVHEGTPVAYLLNEQGQVSAPFASGADEVLALAKSASSGAPPETAHERTRLKSERSLAESRIERDGLKAGMRAPDFRLPDLQGKTLSLDDYRGQRVLLVFSDPNCGPCDELAPHLTSLHQQQESNGVAIVLVGRGSVEENRKKAQKFGFQFPVVLQEKWKLSKEYGIFATPVAFLVAENGLIARDVAIGKNAILALAADAAKSEQNGDYHEFAVR
jgi:peroxiredoxin